MTPERWREIEVLFHAALERPADERAAFLAVACPGDETLRREVEHLLGQPGSDEGFLAGRAVAMAGALAAARPAAMIGRTLGTYQVEALVGVGGMGEVYRARDGKLGREVAIKVLPHAFTSDPTRLARFEREARTLAALNHPNICAIYGFEEAEHVRFLILELVDGDTLADRLAGSRQRPDGAGLPQREALNLARQIARALDFAHGRGIVHRDLKPANIKITADGSVKVLDFGLAKAAAGDAAGADMQPLPTVTVDGTIEGAIIGTPAYMSPEQARGMPVDKRTDIWAFGCVLYEMLTGRAAFSGNTAADTIARILEREPDWTSLSATTPEPIRNLLFGCLAKDPQERLRDIGDVRITIDSILSGSSGAATAVRPVRRRAAWRPWAAVSGAVVVLALVAAGAVWTFRPTPLGQPFVFPLTLDPTESLDRSGGAHVVTLSRDGTQMAYVTTPFRLKIRSLLHVDVKPLPGVEKYKGVREPVFSPDGKEIAFYAFADQTLKRMPIAGDADPLDICQAATPTGISWGPDGIVFGQGRNGIWRVSPNGGLPKQIVRIEEGHEAHGPQVLPGGEYVLFTLASGSARDRWEEAQIVVQAIQSRQGEKPIPLNLTGSDARYVRTGHLVYARSGRVYAVPFDLRRLKTTGNSVQVIPGATGEPGVSRAGGFATGAANFSVSENGTLVYVPGPADPVVFPTSIGLISRSGVVTPLPLPAEPYALPRASPDGTRIAFGNEKDPTTIYTYNLDGKTSMQPLTSGSHNRFPTWAAGGTRIAFQSDRKGDLAIWWQTADGSADAERLTTPVEKGESHIPESWSPTSDTLLFSVTNASGVSLQTLSVERGKPVASQPFGTVHSTDPMSGVFSPDGRWVAYTVTERRMTTVCVAPFPAAKPQECVQQRLADSPKHPRWSPDGKELFVDPRIGDFESVAVTTSPTLSLGNVTAIEKHPFQLAPPGSRTPYDIIQKGRFAGQFVGLIGGDKQVLNQIVVFLNWFDDLKARVPR